MCVCQHSGLWMWEHADAMETEADGFDEALARARSGDETGFLLLWEALHPRLLRYLQVLGCDDVDPSVFVLHRLSLGGPRSELTFVDHGRRVVKFEPLKP